MWPFQLLLGSAARRSSVISAHRADPFAGVQITKLCRIFDTLRSATHRYVVWSDMSMKANRSTPARYPAHHAGAMTSMRVLNEIYLRGRGNRGTRSQAQWRSNAGTPRECKPRAPVYVYLVQRRYSAAPAMPKPTSAAPVKTSTPDNMFLSTATGSPGEGWRKAAAKPASVAKARQSALLSAALSFASASLESEVFSTLGL
jgi:hypothetical protein